MPDLLRYDVFPTLHCLVRLLTVFVGALAPVYAYATPSPGVPITVPYVSSVDGASLNYHEYVPTDFYQSATYKLAILLPGSGGNIFQYDIKPEWRQEADARGYILATVQPRLLAGYNNRITFYINGALAPGEQDVLDVIPVLLGRYNIDLNRIYLAGYSMGGYGTLNIASLNPGIFAAVAAGAPISDLFQQVAFGMNPTPSFESLLGGSPDTNAAAASAWYKNSPRFLLSNLMNTPISFLHGTADTAIPNALSIAPYMQSRHIVDVTGHEDARGQSITLHEYAAGWPGRFIEEHSWPQVIMESPRSLGSRAGFWASSICIRGPRIPLP